ncbi:MAG: carotenoid oxygenase family protein [Ilumatobacteraceae bacterium]
MGNSISRRDLVRWSLLGAGSVPIAAVIAACSDGRGDSSSGAASSTAPRATIAPPTSSAPTATSTTATTATTAAPGTTVAVDPSKPWWLQGNFAPVMQEVDAVDLEIRGALPPELLGTYVKNGSNPPRSDSPHWFFGDGMVHGLGLGGGKAHWYRNRWVQTEPYLSGAGFGEGAPGGGGNQSNVSALWHGGKLLTSGEVGFPYQLDPAELTTIGVYDYDGALTSAYTAHPKIDPVTGRMHSFGYGFSAPFLQYNIIEADGTLSHSEPIEVPRSTMMHDFQITETDAIFWDMPIVFDLDMAVRYIQNPSPENMPYVWRPEFGSRIGVMPLMGGADRIKWFDIDPCYVFHSVNAFRRGDEVVVDVCRLSSVFAEGKLGGEPSLRRWTVNTATGAVADDVLATDDPGDLPGRDLRRVGREHRYGYLTGTRENPDTVELGGIIKHDFTSGTRETWEPGPTRHASEPYFVPGDAADLADDAGWLLSFVHDDAAGETVLAVLDATDVAAGPIAEVVMPQRVPYGFHATWIPGDG